MSAAVDESHADLVIADSGLNLQQGASWKKDRRAGGGSHRAHDEFYTAPPTRAFFHLKEP